MIYRTLSHCGMCTCPTANATINLSCLSSVRVCRPPFRFSASFHGDVHDPAFALGPSFCLSRVLSLWFDHGPCACWHVPQLHGLPAQQVCAHCPPVQWEMRHVAVALRLVPPQVVEVGEAAVVGRHSPRIASLGSNPCPNLREASEGFAAADVARVLHLQSLLSSLEAFP